MILFAFLGGLFHATGCTAMVTLNDIKLPDGFAIAIYADNLPGARSLALSPKGVLYVATRTEGKVYAVIDRDNDNTGETVHTIASGLNMPNGVAWRDGALYVAEVSRILKYDDIDTRLAAPGKPQIIRDDLPTDRHHGWKFIAFGPDGLLYVPVGAPCNICEPDDPYAAILRMKADGSSPEVFARGVRNSVGFDWHPATGELWFTDNGRDWLGDDQPADELNHVLGKGMHFGYPYRHGRDVADPEYGHKISGGNFTPPALELGAHVAPLGMRFYTGKMFPDNYRGRIFIAQHGSWNRSTPVGYRVMTVELDGNKVSGYREFATGWLQGEKAWGRPVDLLIMPDGALLVSDDKAGVVYRISYQP